MMQDAETDSVFRLSEENPGYEKVITQVYGLISSYPPPFIYINDPVTPRITSSVVKSTLSIIAAASSKPSSNPQQILYAQVNAVACFTARLLYDSVLNALANWRIEWDRGCENWSADGDMPRWNESLDGFMHGLRAIRAHLGNAGREIKQGGKSKAKANQTVESDIRIVVVIERAERLSETLPDMIVSLSRLAELVSSSILLCDPRIGILSST